MKILWFTWKDSDHPQAGGAELVNEELAKRLVKDGHKVVFLVSGYKGGKSETKRNGYSIIRIGGKWSVYLKAFSYYKKHLRGKFHLVIDEVNTVPFFCKYYVKEKNIVFIHQLCRKIWFHQLWFPLSFIGWLIEPIFLWLLNDRKTITVSNSTQTDLVKYGFGKKNISIISEGIPFAPPPLINVNQKEKFPTLLYLGSIRAMKRPNDVLKAFQYAKNGIPHLRLWVAGSGEGRYFKSFLKKIKKSKFSESIKYFGKVDEKKKMELLKKSHIFCATSIREGWGITVTEANAMGTPAVGYNVPGLRDSIMHNKTGLLCKKNDPKNLAKEITSLLKNHNDYMRFRRFGWEWSKTINFDKSYQEFKNIIKYL